MNISSGLKLINGISKVMQQQIAHNSSNEKWFKEEPFQFRTEQLDYIIYEKSKNIISVPEYTDPKYWNFPLIPKNTDV